MAEEENKEKKKSASLVLVVVIGILVILLVIIGLFVVLLMGGNEENEKIAEQASSAAVAAATQEQKAPSRSMPKERSNDFFNVGPMYPLDQFLVNLLSETGSRYLKMEINLELSAETLTPEIDQKKPLLRDIIIRILTSRTYEDVSTAKGKERLKDEIATKLNEILRDGYIKNVFFTDFIVQ